MKQSKYRSIFYFYLSFISIIICLLIAGIFIFHSMVTLKIADGSTIKSNWAKETTQKFSDYIFFNDDIPSINQAGMEKLQKNEAWIQIVDQNGDEVKSYLKPDNIQSKYSLLELMQITEYNDISRDSSIFYGTVQNDKKESYIYIICYPLNITEVTMYLNGSNFSSGKSIVFIFIILLFIIIMLIGFIYNYWITKNLTNMTKAIGDIKDEIYLPIQNKGSFENVFNSLNQLNEKIRHSNQIQKETDIMREQWIANITHDLKTPLSPIKGYAEFLIDKNNEFSKEKAERYAKVIIKNIDYAQVLIDDMKTIYQLDNGMLPIRKNNGNIVSFLRNIIIDILNQPDFENESIIFDNDFDEIDFKFDEILLKRAFDNLIINSFMHGGKEIEINVRIMLKEKQITIIISDNGIGMEKEEARHLFDRYYRGTNSKQTEGTGLGLAITKQIIILHGGEIKVETELGKGTEFIITFLTN